MEPIELGDRVTRRGAPAEDGTVIGIVARTAHGSVLLVDWDDRGQSTAAEDDLVRRRS